MMDSLFMWLEKKKLIEKAPAFQPDFDKNYPFLRAIEENYEDIRKECLSLLEKKQSLIDVANMAGDQLKGGIHAVKWKSFTFKSGFMVKNSRLLCPVTYDTIEKIPNVATAFFSILDPGQYIKPHRGYYQGIMRYHLGVVIPDNNKESKCWLRIHDDPEDNRRYDKSTIVKGEKYYWRNGEAILFNDNFLHDATNETEETRVILWLDVKRKMPHIFNLINVTLMNIAHMTKFPIRVRRLASKTSLELYEAGLQKAAES